MENKKQENVASKNFVFEISLRIRGVDYQVRLSSRSSWVLSVVLCLLRLWFLLKHDN